MRCFYLEHNQLCMNWMPLIILQSHGGISLLKLDFIQVVGSLGYVLS